MNKVKIKKIYISIKEQRPIKICILNETSSKAVEDANREVLENDDLFIILYYVKNGHRIGSFYNNKEEKVNINVEN